MTDKLPATPAELTPEMLNELLVGTLDGGTIVSVEAHDIGEGTGIFGQIARLDLGVEGAAGNAPTSVVAKMACTEPANLEIALMLGLYDREIKMFEHVLDDTPLTTPMCHGAVEQDDGQFLLLLENMSIAYDVGDQIVGATLLQAEAAIDALAAMHAHWWERPELDAMDWLPVPNAPQYVAAVPNIYRAGLPVLESEWADRVPPRAIDVARSVDPQFEELLHRTAGGPTTLIHGDTRLDNIFFSTTDDSVAFIDFQLALRGRAVADIAYLIGTSVPHELGRENWESTPSPLARGGRRSRRGRILLRRRAHALSRGGVVLPVGRDVAHRDVRRRQRSGGSDGRGLFDAHPQPRGRHRRSRRALTAQDRVRSR